MSGFRTKEGTLEGVPTTISTRRWFEMLAILPTTSEAALGILVERANLRATIARRPDLSDTLRGRLIDDSNAKVRANAYLGLADPDELTQRYPTGSTSEQLAILANPHTPRELIAEALSTSNAKMLWAAAKNPNTPSAELVRALRRVGMDSFLSGRYAQGQAYLVARIGAILETQPELGQMLAYHEDGRIRRLVASTPYIADNITARLANDTSPTVRNALGANPTVAAQHVTSGRAQLRRLALEELIDRIGGLDQIAQPHAQIDVVNFGSQSLDRLLARTGAITDRAYTALATRTGGNATEGDVLAVLTGQSSVRACEAVRRYSATRVRIGSRWNPLLGVALEVRSQPELLDELERAGCRLGDEHGAWALFSSLADGWNGGPETLAEAALALAA